jgi:hypothetical protein
MMKWDREKSIILSKICIWIFAVIGLVCVFLAPAYAPGLVIRRGMEAAEGRKCFLLSFYLLYVPVCLVLVELYRLLQNMARGKVFVSENVRLLRVISWACFLAALICLISVSYYIPFLILTAACAFMGLIIRVVKNVFSAAIELKEENDLTV